MCTLLVLEVKSLWEMDSLSTWNEEEFHGDVLRCRNEVSERKAELSRETDEKVIEELRNGLTLARNQFHSLLIEFS